MSDGARGISFEEAGVVDSGASVPAWGGRRATDALDRVRAEGRRLRQPCCICRQPIDYSLPATHPQGCTVQHVRSRKHFPHLTWVASNWKPAHRECNTSAGAGDRGEQHGVTSTDW